MASFSSSFVVNKRSDSLIRLFVALDLDSHTKEELENFAKSLNIDQARIIQAKNMHITVKFLGYVEENIVDNIDQLLKDVALKHKPFDLILDKLGAFPSRKKGRIFWLGANESLEAKELASDLDSALTPLGFEKEKRAFKVHLTLARLKTPINLTKYFEQKINVIKQKIGHIMLYESKLSSKGAQYRPIKKYFLKKA